jgi:hypothetical protein
MYKVNCWAVVDVIAPDASSASILATGSGAYEVTRKPGPDGDKGVNCDAAGAAKLLAGDDPSLMIAALRDARGRIDKLIGALETLAAAQEFDPENPR